MTRGQPQRDVRHAPNGGVVTVKFFAGPRWEQFGDTMTIERRQPHVHSRIAMKPTAVYGSIYHDDVEVFRSEPMLLNAGDTFTFNFGEASG